MLARPRSTTRLAAAVLFVAALVVAQLAQLSHFFLVPHALCEHGDLVHATASVFPPERGDGDGAPRARAGAPGARGHEHCDANAVRAQFPTVDAIERPPATLTFVIDGAARPEDASIALDVLDLAPKSSPPRV